MMDTIFALATPPGRSGVAVVRVSGSLAKQACMNLAGLNPRPRMAELRWLKDEENNRFDQALVLFFEGPKSFSGEDVLEIQTHGSVGVVKKLINILSSFQGFRMAKPGEFTERALFNEKIGLTELEGLGELLAAETEMQVGQAMRLMSGDLAEKASRWRTGLLEAKTAIEAAIDFSDEEIDEDIFLRARPMVEPLLVELKAELNGISRAERVRSGFEIAILGSPNAGKSTLLNQIARRDVAIVSEIAGTTRDIIETQVEIHGYPVRFLDTAGIRETKDPIERDGVERARSRGLEADLRLWLLQPGEDRPQDAKEGDIIVTGRSDIDPRGDVSGLTGAGLDFIFERIVDTLEHRKHGDSLATNARHRNCLVGAISSLEEAIMLGSNEHAVELSAHCLNQAARHLDQLTGRLDVEDVLGSIFSNFCIGK